MEKTNGQQEVKRYLIRSERFFGILYDRQQKRSRTIPAAEVAGWRARADTDFIDYQAVEASDPRTAFGAPVLLFLDITARCQCRCWFCYNRSGEPHSPDMPSEEVRRLIRRFAELGGVELRLSGGEPTLHPDLPGFIDLAGDLGLRTILVSNGMIEPAVLEYLSGSPVTACYFSLQGDRAVHDAARGAGSYDKCCSSARALIASGVRVRLSMTYHKRNQQFLEHIVDVAEKLGASVAFNPLRPFGRAGLADMLDPDEHHRLVKKVIELQQSHPHMSIDTPWSYLLHPPGTPAIDPAKRLGCGGNALNVSITGDCFGCGQLSTYPAFRLGNIHQDDMQSIWLRSRGTCQLANAPLAEKCQSCAYLSRSPCFGGCMATALVSRGSLSAGDPYCFVDLLEKETA